MLAPLKNLPTQVQQREYLSFRRSYPPSKHNQKNKSPITPVKDKKIQNESKSTEKRPSTAPWKKVFNDNVDGQMKESGQLKLELLETRPSTLGGLRLGNEEWLCEKAISLRSKSVSPTLRSSLNFSELLKIDTRRCKSASRSPLRDSIRRRTHSVAGIGIGEYRSSYVKNLFDS